MNPVESKAPASFLQRVPWLRILAGCFTLGVIAAALVPTFHEAGALRGSLDRLDWRWILGAAGCQIAVYCCVAAILGVTVRACGERASALYLVFVAFAFLFANRAMAVAGMTTLVALLRRRSISASAAQTAAASFYLADYAGFFALAILALAALMHSGGSDVLHPRVLIPAIVAVAIGVAGALTALRSEDRLERLAERAALRVTRLLRRPDPQETARRAAAAAAAFHARWFEMTRRPGPLLAACAAALLMHAAEVGTLLCAARAFHAALTTAAASAGYVGGNLAAMVSLLPGGLGFFEGAMTVTFHGLGGLKPADALGVTLIYRLLSVWLPLPIVLGVVREAMGKRTQGREIFSHTTDI